MPTSITTDQVEHRITYRWLGGAGLSASQRLSDSTVTRTNLFTNPSFESSLAGWSPSSATTVTRDTTTSAYAGFASAKLVSKGGGRNYINAEYTLVAGSTYTISTFVKLPAATATPYGFVVEFYDNFTNYGYLGEANSEVAVQNATEWTRVFMTFTMPPGATGALIYPIISNGTAPVGETIYVDSILLETGPTLDDYFDGSTSSTVEYVILEPILVDGWTESIESRNIINAVMGGDVDVTPRVAAKRTGSFLLLFGTEEDAKLAFDVHRTAGLFHLTDSERPSLDLSYVLSGTLSRALDEETRVLWVVTVNYQEL